MWQIFEFVDFIVPVGKCVPCIEHIFQQVPLRRRLVNHLEMLSQDLDQDYLAKELHGALFCFCALVKL